MKKVVSLLILISVLFTCIYSVSASGEITVTLDGAIISFDVQPQIIDGRTMVPMRKIFEALGAVVTWDEASKTVTGRKGDTIVNVFIDSKTLFKNGTPTVLDVAPTLIDGRTLVPARAIAESFDCEVTWIAETKTVKITTSEDFRSQNTKLTASEIAEKVAPSVFYIEVYDEDAEPIASGSGFFIEESGVAVTNYHVIEDTYSAVITTVAGDRFNVDSIIAFDEELDVAIIRVNNTSLEGKKVYGFPSAIMANSDNVKAGQTVYALGSPKGLQNTISNGIISNTNQQVGENSFIQITAPISHGSSGGALVDEYGEVLGITSAVIDDAQNIGFAIPINVVSAFDLTKTGVSYAEFADRGNEFIIIVSDEVIEIEVGETKEILVYANGKEEEWSIYWETDEYEDTIVGCKWGDWLENYNSICPLAIKGLKEGVATITIYSDVDFKGVEVTVYVKKPKIEYYPSSCIKVPTFTSVTGIPYYDFVRTSYPSGRNYWRYHYNDIEDVMLYETFLINNGFRFFQRNEELIYYWTPENILLPIMLNNEEKIITIFIEK